jgi:hypothetical protein
MEHNRRRRETPTFRIRNQAPNWKEGYADGLKALVESLEARKVRAAEIEANNERIKSGARKQGAVAA